MKEIGWRWRTDEKTLKIVSSPRLIATTDH